MKDVSIDPVLVTFKQYVKRLVTTIGVSGDQITVVKLSQFLHC